MDESVYPEDSGRICVVRASFEGLRGKIPVCGDCAQYGATCSCSDPNQRAESCYLPNILEEVSSES